MSHIAVNEINSISGEIWNDKNTNGIKDNDEPFLSDINIELLNFEGTVIQTIKSQDGFYQFKKLAPGPYVIKAVLGSNFLQTAPGAITTFHPTPVTGPWDYSDTNGLPVGPSEWYKIAPDADGFFQSPINIAGIAPNNLGEVLTFNYHETHPTELVNKGTNIEIEYSGGNGNTINFTNQQFELVQFHFHYSSEHQLNGQLSDMELHMVHRNKDGGLAVVGLLIKEGATNQTLEPFFEGVKNATNKITEIEEPIDLNQLIPANKDGWYYQGSLTAPSATEGVNWFVFKDTIELSIEQIDIFQNYLATIGFDHNNRPVQPLNGRQLNEFNHEITLAEGNIINNVDFGVIPLQNTNFIASPIGNNLGSLFYDTRGSKEDVSVKTEDTALSQTDALFHNLVGLYQVQDVNGSILDTLDLNGNGSVTDLLNPTDAGYAQTAISNAVSNFILQLGAKSNTGKNTTATEFGDILLQGGRLFAPFVIANGGNLISTGGTLQTGLDNFLAQNPGNVGSTLDNFMTHAVAYFSFGSANPDNGSEHLQNRGNNTFGFEDLPGNLNVSDFDFNDSVFQFTFPS